VTGNEMVMIRFVVPRKMEGMDSDLYPPILSKRASNTCED